MSAPLTISVTAGTWSAFTYNKVSSVGTEHTYRPDWNSSSDYYDIKFDTSDNKWYDVGAGAPSHFWNHTDDSTGAQAGSPSVACATGDEIRLTDSGTSGVRGTLTHPDFGSNTSTEEVLVEDAKIVYYGGITGHRFEQRGYAAASYELLGNGGPYNWTISTASNNLQHHISSLNVGTYYLWSGGVQLLSLQVSESVSKRKVHCNFW